MSSIAERGSFQGDGYIRFEMHFLADVYVPCEQCKGRRFNASTLEILYKGHSIADILDLSVAEAYELFANHPPIKAVLETLMQVGLSYIKLGQPATTLSGGQVIAVGSPKIVAQNVQSYTGQFLKKILRNRSSRA